MEKALSNGKPQIYHLIGIEGIFISLTSKLSTYFIDGFTLGKESSQLLIYWVEVNIYIGFCSLKMRCTQYGFYGQGGLQEYKSNFFWRWAGRAMFSS